MDGRREESESLLTRKSYPALMEFFAGVFAPGFRRWSMARQHGRLLRLFSDANGDQIRNVKEEWQALRQAFSGRTLPDMQSVAGATGSGVAAAIRTGAAGSR